MTQRQHEGIINNGMEGMYVYKHKSLCTALGENLPSNFGGRAFVHFFSPQYVKPAMQGGTWDIITS